MSNVYLYELIRELKEIFPERLPRFQDLSLTDVARRIGNQEVINLMQKKLEEET
jgi:hypothetical protein